MVAQAKFLYGDPEMINYTPGSAVTGGDVVVTGNCPFVAHSDIAANKLGGLSRCGGVYNVTCAQAITGVTRVYWDDTNNVVTTIGAGNSHFGFTMPGYTCSANGTIPVLHAPSQSNSTLSTTTAATGSAQGDAAALTEGINYVTGADGTKGVILTAKMNVAYILNPAGSALKVYPESGAAINAGAANAALSVPTVTGCVLVRISSILWMSIPKVPS